MLFLMSQYSNSMKVFGVFGSLTKQLKRFAATLVEEVTLFWMERMLKAITSLAGSIQPGHDQYL